ncbi:hypothetical protein L596_014201 [Steinernema carpocapsae]|uniref:Uncharacterized protein n=1 Tax=Steinernema carpocapsae TaxID=34508 RepID=A0A4U5NC09_STECR|nr:hypothetical protein L596_014201 [Steinernema carpocapsae]
MFITLLSDFFGIPFTSIIGPSCASVLDAILYILLMSASLRWALAYYCSKLKHSIQIHQCYAAYLWLSSSGKSSYISLLRNIPSDPDFIRSFYTVDHPFHIESTLPRMSLLVSGIVFFLTPKQSSSSWTPLT